MTNIKKNTNRFTVDFIQNQIIGTKASFNKASKGVGEIYEELALKVAKHPDFTLIVKEQKKRSTKAKQTYNGLNFKLMEEFISIQKDGEQIKKEYEAVKEFAEKNGKSIYPNAKKWFLSKFDNFNVEAAKVAISDALIAEAVESVSTNPADKQEKVVSMPEKKAG